MSKDGEYTIPLYSSLSKLLLISFRVGFGKVTGTFLALSHVMKWVV